MQLPLFAAIALHIGFFYGILANLIVIVLYCINKNCTFDQKSFIISLNIADFLAMLLGYFSFILSNYVDVIKNSAWLFICNSTTFVLSATMHCSAVQLSIVAIYRYLTVTKLSFNSFNLKKLHCLLLILGLWIFSFLPTIIAVFGGWCQLTFLKPKKICTFNYPNCLSYAFFNIVLYTITPIITVTVSYSALFLVVRKKRKKIFIQEPTRSTGNSQFKTRLQFMQENRENRLMIQIGVITIIFMVCWIPGSTIGRFVGYKDNSKEFIGYVTSGLFVVNSAVNPLVYLLPNGQMRKQLKSLFCCRRE